MITKKVIGIISYLPSDNYVSRQQRLVMLLNQIHNYWPLLPIYIVAQNWKDNNFLPTNLNITIFNYDQPLGILNARKKLREYFLNSEYEQIIMFDDDAVIETSMEAAQQFLIEADNHPQGFTFLKGWKRDPLGIYNPAQLNGCVVSKWLIEAEPFKDEWDPQQFGIYEDVVWSHLLHWKYPEYEYEVKGFQCVQWNNSRYPLKTTWHAQSNNCLNKTRLVLKQVENKCIEWRKNHRK